MPAKKYSIIYEDLKRKIEAGVYKPQSCLPTEYALVDMYKCSRNTIRRAVKELSEIGYVQSIHGKGVIVIYRKSEANVFSFDVIESMKEAAARNNREYHTKVIHFTTFKVDEYLSRKTGFQIGEEVYYIQRVRYFDDVPMILDNNWFLTRVVPGLTAEIAEKSVYEYLENVVGDTIVTTRRTLTVEKITEIDEKYLNLVDCGAMAVVTSETYNAAGEMFEYTQSRHRPDMFAFYSVARRRK
jgi:GntR family trehalose operon transcriptional repressor